jgi:uncharacterized membrane protein
MESLIALFVLACVLTFVGAILGIIAFAKLGTVNRELKELKTKLAHVKRLLAEEPGATGSEQRLRQASERDPVRPQPATTPSGADAASEGQRHTEPPAATTEQPAHSTTRSAENNPTSETQASTAQTGDSRKPPPTAPPTLNIQPSPFVQSLQRNWMAWLGGICIALAGIFLGKYSIEQGLLGPGLRVALGIATGLALHAVAIWLRVKKGGHPSLAAMAGGGSITLFATLLAALHYYQMFSPTLVFIVLAIVALMTMWLAISHGPLLAAIGMLGAYAVPIMVSTGSGNMLAALIYAAIISLSVLLLAKVVKISWLWWGALFGALAWWVISLDSHQVEGLRGLYLAVLAYQFIAVCSGNWWLRKSDDQAVWLLGYTPDESTKHQATGTAGQAAPWETALPTALLLITLAQLITVAHVGWLDHWPKTMALPAVLLVTSIFQPRLLAVVWVMLLGSLVSIVLPLYSDPNLLLDSSVRALAQPGTLFTSLTVFGLLFMVASLAGYKRGAYTAWWMSLFAMAPVLSSLAAFLVAEDSLSQTAWSMLFVGIAAAQFAVAVMATRKTSEPWLSIWHFIAAHLGYAVAVAIIFEATTLTLALAAQILSLAWLIKRFDARSLAWLLKLVVLVVVIRLTVNPWLLDYPPIWHWPLWTYGGATLLCYLASTQLRGQQALRQWTEAAALHLFVLTLWTEARYLLHDGRVFMSDYSFTEATLYIGLFGALSLVYHHRANISQTIARWYQAYATFLWVFALLNYAGILLNLLYSEPWAVEAIGARPIANLMTLALGLPLVLSGLFVRYYRGAATIAKLFLGAASFIFVSFQIRHLWQGSASLELNTSAGELYTYSVVWLVMAVAAMLFAGIRQQQNLYRGGLVMLSVVILKIFLVDMSDLDGLLRVASFMGLGLALLGISFLHQKLKPSDD